MVSIIGIHGKIGSGKDTVGNMIQYLTSRSGQEKVRTFEEFLQFKDRTLPLGIYQSDWDIKKFAFKLKQIVSILTGISTADLEIQEIKDSFLPSYWDWSPGSAGRQPAIEGSLENRYTVREVLQRVGTEAMRDQIHTDVWVNALFSDLNEDSKWIITDTRFPNEAKAIKDIGGKVIKITRPSIVSVSTHPSEIALDNYDQFDYEIVNDGSLQDLKLKVMAMLIDLKIEVNATAN